MAVSLRGCNPKIDSNLESISLFKPFLYLPCWNIESSDNDNTGIFHVSELRVGMNEFDHSSFIIAG